MNPGIVSRLRELLAEIRPQLTGVPLGPDDDLVQVLGLDSLDISNLMVEVEAEYDVRIELARLPHLNTLNMLAAHVAQTGMSLERGAGEAGDSGEVVS